MEPESLDQPEEERPSERASEDALRELREALRRPEEVIAGRYRVLRVLGRGGAGTTYEAEDLEGGTRVALKELTLRHLREWKSLDMFERESRVLAGLQHSGIPRYLAHFEVDEPHDRFYYLAQELAPGKSLAALIEEGWRPGEVDVREIATQILEILVYLQELSPPVIHRDIKPSNVLLRPDGTVSLVDFGSVQDTYRNTLTQGSTVVGTYGYMAPEQFRGQAALSSDIYGLGATMLYLLSRRHPSDFPQRKLRLQFRDKLRMTPSLAAWLERALEPAAEDRFPTARTALAELRGQRAPGERVAPRWSDLWRWDGTVDRGPYAILGLTLFAIKYNLDRFVAGAMFNRKWYLYNYLYADLRPDISNLSGPDLTFSATLVMMALPFIYTGVVLTLRRLRAVGLPSWMVVLFFVPLVNLILFAMLSLMPSREQDDHNPDDISAHLKAILDRLIPDHPVGSAAMAILMLLPFAAGATALSVYGLSSYGWGLFVGMPFALGLGSTLLYGYHRPRDLASCMLVAAIAVGLLGAILVAIAVEGVICVAMAAPIGLALAALGAAIGYVIQSRPRRTDAPPALISLVLSVPLLMGAETAVRPAPPLMPVTTSVEIDAPPARVWRHVVAFTELPPPNSWVFHSGIAYPMRAEIRGHGVGAVRRCVFSTGAFIEPIRVWNEPRLLRFGVTAQPPAMREMSPYPDLHAPHLDDFLRSRQGEFLLTPLPGGRTRLAGTTWYEHKIWPVTYWRLWSDFIIHRIHTRVLDHVKNLAEGH